MLYEGNTTYHYLCRGCILGVNAANKLEKINEGLIDEQNAIIAGLYATVDSVAQEVPGASPYLENTVTESAEAMVAAGLLSAVLYAYKRPGAVFRMRRDNHK
jgi:hypothetical protein